MDTTKQRKPPQEWTAEEDKSLAEAIGMYGEGHWSQVADYVKTKTAHQCLQRWTLTLNPNIIKGRFSKEENKLLRETVETNGPENWPQIAENIPGRTRKQCRVKWIQSLDPNIIKGQFSKEEDKLLTEAVERYGTRNWSRIASFVPGRTARQCRDRWNKHLNPNVSEEPFTPDEDQLILRKWGELGNKWAKIAALLSRRTDAQVHNRFKFLQKCQAKLKNQAKAKKLQTKDSKTIQMEIEIYQEKLEKSTTESRRHSIEIEIEIRQAELERRQELQQDAAQQSVSQPEFQTNQAVEETSIFGIDYLQFLELENQLTNMPFSNPTDTNRKVKVSAGSNETYQNIANANEEFEQNVETNKSQEEISLLTIF